MADGAIAPPLGLRFFTLFLCHDTGPKADILIFMIPTADCGRGEREKRFETMK